MRLGNDDVTSTVDNIFLGPKGWELWWQARYSAYGIGAVLFLIALPTEAKIGVHIGIWSLVFTTLAVVVMTRKIGTVITYETPFRALASTFRHEISAPRHPRTGTACVLLPRQVKVGPPLRARWSPWPALTRTWSGSRALITDTKDGK